MPLFFLHYRATVQFRISTAPDQKPSIRRTSHNYLHERNNFSTKSFKVLSRKVTNLPQKSYYIRSLTSTQLSPHPGPEARDSFLLFLVPCLKTEPGKNAKAPEWEGPRLSKHVLIGGQSWLVAPVPQWLERAPNVQRLRHPRFEWPVALRCMSYDAHPLSFHSSAVQQNKAMKGQKKQGKKKITKKVFKHPACCLMLWPIWDISVDLW